MSKRNDLLSTLNDHFDEDGLCVSTREEVLDGLLYALETPDEEMLNLARDWSIKKYGQGIGNDAAIGCWKAMLGALRKHG